MRVALIGNGHYANDLAAPRYKRLGCDTKIIGRGEPIPDADIYDLCVFEDAVLPLVCQLRDMGARNIVLPKQVCKNMDELRELVSINIKFAIASQWQYDEDLILRLSMGTHIKIRFAQWLHQIKYNPFNSFLPHALTMLYGASSVLDKAEIMLHDKERLIVTFGNICIDIDLNKTVHPLYRERYVNIDGLETNLLNRGDVLFKMIDSHVNYFGDKYANNEFDLWCPVIEKYLSIKEMCGVE